MSEFYVPLYFTRLKKFDITSNSILIGSATCNMEIIYPKLINDLATRKALKIRNEHKGEFMSEYP